MSGVMPTGLTDRSDGVQKVVLAAALSSVPAARRRVRADLVARGVRPDVIDNTLLVVTELVSNAILHARPATTGAQAGVVLLWTIENDLVLVDVTDGGGRSRPRRTKAEPTDSSGRGLTIVDAIAQDWSVTTENGQVTVRAIVGS